MEVDDKYDGTVTEKATTIISKENCNFPSNVTPPRQQISSDSMNNDSSKSNLEELSNDDKKIGVVIQEEIVRNGSMRVDHMDYSMEDISATDDLRQFDVLDDLERHEDQNYSDVDSVTDDSMDSDVPDEEIEAMLEEGGYKFHKFKEYSLNNNYSNVFEVKFSIQMF